MWNWPCRRHQCGLHRFWLEGPLSPSSFLGHLCHLWPLDWTHSGLGREVAPSSPGPFLLGSWSHPGLPGLWRVECSNRRWRRFELWANKSRLRPLRTRPGRCCRGDHSISIQFVAIQITDCWGRGSLIFFTLLWQPMLTARPFVELWSQKTWVFSYTRLQVFFEFLLFGCTKWLFGST